jgi:hypothetical protein
MWCSGTFCQGNFILGLTGDETDPIVAMLSLTFSIYTDRLTLLRDVVADWDLSTYLTKSRRIPEELRGKVVYFTTNTTLVMCGAMNMQNTC